MQSVERSSTSNAGEQEKEQPLDLSEQPSTVDNGGIDDSESEIVMEEPEAVDNKIEEYRKELRTMREIDPSSAQSLSINENDPRKSLAAAGNSLRNATFGESMDLHLEKNALIDSLVTDLVAEISLDSSNKLYVNHEAWSEGMKEIIEKVPSRWRFIPWKTSRVRISVNPSEDYSRLIIYLHTKDLLFSNALNTALAKNSEELNNAFKVEIHLNEADDRPSHKSNQS